MLDQNQLRVLKQVGRYRLSFAEATQRLLELDSKEQAVELLDSLVEGCFLDKRDEQKGLAANCPYYVLTAEGVKLLELPPDRVKFSDLSKHLAILWFCSMNKGKNKRLRVEQRELKSILDMPHHNVPHVLEKTESKFVIHRIYTPDESKIDQIVKTCKGFFENIGPSREQAIQQGDYGFAVLSQLKMPIGKLRQHLQNLPNKKTCLSKRARFIVELGPSTSSFPTEYAALKPE